MIDVIFWDIGSKTRMGLPGISAAGGRCEQDAISI
jgi:hypothetical protein